MMLATNSGVQVFGAANLSATSPALGDALWSLVPVVVLLALAVLHVVVWYRLYLFERARSGASTAFWLTVASVLIPGALWLWVLARWPLRGQWLSAKTQWHTNV
ncbi:hypothetical protein [Corynebacterium aquilae]|uniref:hypothetical protein n=1 Tax=Corynebacterium aquilae TaxID=203263 RepID=UPI000952E2DA|nr:hypothetical protein [Corynebacterium aquilae]